MKIYSGNSYLPLIVAIGIWSVSALTALPGLAISPILGDLQSIFPKASQMEIQMLTSLPSLLILPFIIISGYLTQKVNIYKLLIAGLIIFGLTGFFYLISTKMWQLILVSALLGIGSGMIIPLSTGLISMFFTGKARTKQFGLNSAISNLTVVIATFITGFLAGVNWRLPFLVYLLPLIVVFLAMPLRKYWPVENTVTEENKNAKNNTTPDNQFYSQSNISIGKYGLDLKHLGNIMTLYGILTFIVAIIIFYIPFFITDNGMSENLSGTIISLFFLAIMLPGLFLTKILDTIGEQTMLIALFMITVGFLLIILANNQLPLILGVILAGGGYGIMQPIFYDKATSISLPSKNTIALACIMAMNYLAIVLCPVLVDGFKDLLQINGNIFAFRLGTAVSLSVLSLAIFKNKSFVFNV